MKKLTNIVYWLVLSFLIIYLLYQKGYIFRNFEQISAENAYNRLLIDRNITLLDVRTPEEIQEDGKIKNSLLVPLQILERNIDKLQPYKNKRLFIYCRSGNRSITASRVLSDAGFKTYNIQGGIITWRKEGLPIE
ncbi:MAG: rhodanese-like domain-containing protein [Epsilonproteobacteria bacterium]|nr:rhodanese-like domain-containing protein [Campylobacterota bacterium]